MSDREPQLHQIAALIGDPSRATMLLSLIGGRQLPASDLARRAHIAPATASEHLAKLMAGGLVRARVHGRYRYYQLASSDVATLLEALIAVTPPTPVRSLRESTMMTHLRLARTCYDHLAGLLGTGITDAMLSAGWLAIDPDTEMLIITDRGHEQFAYWKLPLQRNKGRPMIRSCLDWSERRYHVAGQLGSALAHWFFTERWIIRGASDRAVQVTEPGVVALHVNFGISWPPDMHAQPETLPKSIR